MADKDEKKPELAAKAKKTAFYEDDYIAYGVVPEGPYTPEVKFSFKPLNVIQVAQLTDAIVDGGVTVEVSTRKNLEMITEHLLSWDLRDGNDKVVDFKDMEMLSRISATVSNTIIGTLRGDRGTPAADVEAIKAELKNLL